MPALLLILGLWAQTPPTVTGMSPAPGTTLDAVSNVTLTFNQNINPGSVSGLTVTLVGSGTDGLFGTLDDVTLTPVSITVASNQITLDLTGQFLPNDVYRVRLSGTLATPATHSGLYAYWKLNEGTLTTTADASGNGHNGTLNGPAWTANGLFGKALVFSPGVNRVDLSAGVVPTPWTASMWVKRVDSPGIESALMDTPGATLPATSLRLEQLSPLNHVGITQYAVADYWFNYIAPVGTWVHLTFVGTSLTSTSLYVNGVLTDTIPNGINLYAYMLGGERGSSFSGTLDEVQVYNRTLTPAEIATVGGLTGCVRSTTGGILDGENFGSFPSGDGTPGGDFTATFTILAIVDLRLGGCGLGAEILLPLGVFFFLRRRARHRFP